MNKLIIDATKEKIFFIIITKDNKYNIAHENTKNNYEKLMLLINKFLNLNKLNLIDISQIYVNRGPGSFAGIRNSLSTIKAIHLAKKIDYYCFSFRDFDAINDVMYEDVPNLCKKYIIKKNLIKPIYLS